MAKIFAEWEHEDPDVYWATGFAFVKKIHIRFWHEKIKTLWFQDNGIPITLKNVVIIT